MRTLEQWLLVGVVAVVLLFSVFRFSFLADVPSGFFVDESSIGYNAWSILHSGLDEHGAAFPLYFKAFGDYKNPLFVYSVVPLLALFGDSITSVRLASALWGAGALIVFFFLLRKMGFSRFGIWGAGLLLVTSPWFVQLSRVAFEVASVPFFLLSAVVIYYVLAESKKLSIGKIKLLVFLFATSLAGAFYAYTATRMIAPLAFIVGLSLIHKKIGYKVFILGGLLFGIYLLPLLFSQTVMSGALSARYGVVGLSHYTHSVGEFTREFLYNYIGHFSPHFLWNGADGNLRHVATPYGSFFLSSIPFLLCGLYVLYKKIRHPFYSWLIFLLLAGPIPSALTIQSPHVLRSVSFLVTLYVVAALGLNWCLQFTGLKKLLTLFLIACVVVQSIIFFYFYTHTFVKNSRAWFEAGTVEIMQHIAEYPQPVYLSTNLYQGTYATAFFFAQPQLNPYTSIQLFNPFTQFSQQPGTYIITRQECATFATQQNSTPFIMNDGACAFTISQSE
ncbi:glycosyltransferase family 39 protein [Candidatus Woesebacteria bacterium]|nr:glycosyltransferase family 39 protein [Candidatus Woesebacteria bacterium]